MFPSRIQAKMHLCVRLAFPKFLMQDSSNLNYLTTGGIHLFCRHHNALWRSLCPRMSHCACYYHSLSQLIAFLANKNAEMAGGSQ